MREANSMSVPRVLVLVAAIILAASSATAQTSEAEARRLFDEGAALLQDGRHLDALARLERARALQEVPAIVFNIAVAQRGLGRYVEAAINLERYVALAVARGLDPAVRAERERLLAETRAAIAHVTVRVEGTGATVTMNGDALRAEQLGRELDLNPGRYRFAVGGAGVAPAEVQRDLASGERTEVALTVRRVEQTGALRIEASVPDAVLYLDRRVVGRGVFESSVAVGPHRVEVRANGFSPHLADVMIAAGRAERLQVLLERSQALWTRWWFWTGVGVVAAGVTAGLIIGLSGTEPPVNGTLGYTVQAVGTQGETGR